jgi:hypothetical protein
MLSISSPDFAIQFEPEGLREMSHRVYFADDLGGYLEEFAGDLTFESADYTYLRRRFFVDGCAVVPVVIEDGCGLTLTGNLFLNEAEWKPHICKVTVQVVDSGFLSLIDQNREIKAFVNVPRSKNDVDISAYTATQTDLVFSLHDTNAIPAQSDAIDRQGVRLYDALRMLVAFMSDGIITMVSDYLNPAFAGEDGIPTLVVGQEIRTGDNDEWPYISFQDLFGDARKLYNLAFAPEIINGQPALRIEPVAYFRQQLGNTVFADVNELNQKAVLSQYYAIMKFGSKRTDPLEYNNQYFPPATFYAWQEEEFHLLGQCNTKANLDLTLSELVTDTNRIQIALPTTAGGQDDDGIDKDIALVTFDSSNVTVIYTNPTDSTERFYNNSLTNFEVANRWGNGVPFPIVQFLGVGSNQAEAVAVTVQNPTWVPVTGLFGARAAFLKFPQSAFPNGFDPSGNITQGVETLQTLDAPLFTFNGDVTGYTAPVSAIFTVQADITFADNVSAFLIVGRFNSGGSYLTRTIMQTVSEDVNILPQTGTRTYGQALVYAAATDRLFIAAVTDANTEINIETFTRSSFTVLDPFTFEQVYDPNDNLLIETDFRYPMGSNEWMSFLNERFKKMTVTYNGGEIQGYIKDVTRQLETGDTDWLIRSNFGNS